MKRFTKEQMELLKSIEPRMRQAQGDYLTSLYSEQKQLVESIYRAAGGERPIVWGCGNCWLSIVKEMGKQYFEQLAEAEKPAETAETKPKVAKAAPKKKPAKKAE